MDDKQHSGPKGEDRPGRKCKDVLDGNVRTVPDANGSIVLDGNVKTVLDGKVRTVLDGNVRTVLDGNVRTVLDGKCKNRFMLILGCLRRFCWVGFLVVCFLCKINPHPRKNICCGKKWLKIPPLT